MVDWQPITSDELAAIVAAAAADCSPDERALFERIKVSLYPTPIERSGKREDVFVVAEHAGAVLFWDDVEGGFELAMPDPDGVLRDYGSNQFELKHLLWQLLNKRGK